MQTADEQATRNWGRGFLERLLRPVAVAVTPLFHVVFILALFFEALLTSGGAGLRSAAAILLPLMVLTYLYVTRSGKDVAPMPNVSRIGHALRLVAGVAVGITVLVGLDALAPLDPGIPIREILLSSNLSLLIFSYTILERGTSMPYYFGTMLGSLVYLVFSFPAF